MARLDQGCVTSPVHASGMCTHALTTPVAIALVILQPVADRDVPPVDQPMTDLTAAAIGVWPYSEDSIPPGMTADGSRALFLDEAAITE